MKKGAHVIEYAVLYWLWVRAINRSPRWSADRWLIAGIICLLYALTDELHQSLVVGRHAKATDVVIDMTGVVLAYWWLRRKIRPDSTGGIQ